MEVLGGGADVADGRVLRLVVPLAHRHLRDARQYVLADKIGEVLLGELTSESVDQAESPVKGATPGLVGKVVPAVDQNTTPPAARTRN